MRHWNDLKCFAAVSQAALVLLLVGCGRGYGGPAPSGDGAAVFGRVFGLLGSPLKDVEICALDIDVPCVTTEGGGDFLLDHLPEESDVVITMTKDDHLSTAYHHNTALDHEWEKTLMSDGIVNTMTNRANTAQQAGRGHAMFILWSGPDYHDFDRVPGVTMKVVGGGGELFYQAGGGFPDPELTETSSSGSGGAFNLEPGAYALEFGGEGSVCEPWFSHDFEPGEPVPITVYPDFGSYIDLVCK